MEEPDQQRAIAAMKDEDALMAGFLTNALDPVRKNKILSNHAPDATWQIWGCFAGYATTSFDGDPDPDLDQYFKRFNLGQTAIPGIAVEIATTFQVTCTAAQGNGLEFWHGTRSRVVERSTTTTPATKPFWLWLTLGSDWVSFGPNGQLLHPVIFGLPRESKDMFAPRSKPVDPQGQPPQWLTALYWGEVPAQSSP